MKVLADRLTECLAQQPSVPLEQPTVAAPRDWDSLEHAHADFTVLAERVMQSHTGTQARVMRPLYYMCMLMTVVS